MYSVYINTYMSDEQWTDKTPWKQLLAKSSEHAAKLASMEYISYYQRVYEREPVEPILIKVIGDGETKFFVTKFSVSVSEITDRGG